MSISAYLPAWSSYHDPPFSGSSGAAIWSERTTLIKETRVMQSLWLEKQKLMFREDIPSPIPEKGQALIHVLLSGVCNTDLELVRGYYPFSGIPGHEFVGEVVSSPEDPSWIGKRVVGESNIACGMCNTCKSCLTRHCENRKTLG